MTNWLQKGNKLSESYIKKAHEKPGGSNVGKYPSNWDFAGPSGGSPKGSYPINTLEHAKSALKLAHNAPSPSGIRSAVYAKYPELKKNQMGGQFSAFQEGGEVKDINSNEAELKPARNKINQFLLNLAGGWEHNKPQLLKDAPILDYAIQPTLDYLAGKGGEENSLAILPSLSKIIPKKFVSNPESYYRMIGGEEGLKDVIESGMIRPNQTGIFSNRKTYYTKGKPNDINNPVIGKGVKKGTYYKGPYMIEVSPGEYFPSVETRLPQWEFGITKPGEHIPTNADNVKIYKQHWFRGYKEIPKKQKGGNLNRYNSLNPREGFGVGSWIDNAILYSFGKSKPRKGTNVATPEEEAYWKIYNKIPQDIVKPTEVRINADKGDTKSEFVGIPETMKERIAALADTLNLGKLVRNPESYRTKFPDSPINYLGLKRNYEFAKKVMNNPGKGQQAKEEYSMKASPIGNTGLGALDDFGLVWDKNKGVLKAYDTYDFPWYIPISDRDKTLKIREEIPFNPKVGSTLLKENFKYFDTIK